MKSKIYSNCLLQSFSIPTTFRSTTFQPKVRFDQANRTVCDDRSSLGIFPADKMCSVTMTNNETFANEMTFGFEPRAKVKVPSHIEARARLPSPPTPDLAEQHALTEFQRLRLAKSSNSDPSKSPNEQRQEKSSNKSPKGGTVFASVNNSAETVIQRKLSER